MARLIAIGLVQNLPRIYVDHDRRVGWVIVAAMNDPVRVHAFFRAGVGVFNCQHGQRRRHADEHRETPARKELEKTCGSLGRVTHMAHRHRRIGISRA